MMWKYVWCYDVTNLWNALQIKLSNPKIKVELSSFNIERNELKFELTEWSYFNFIGRAITDLFRRFRKHEYAVQHDEPVQLYGKSITIFYTDTHQI